MMARVGQILRSMMLAVVLVCSAVMLDGCSAIRNAKDIEVTDFKLKSFSPNGLKGVDAVLALVIDNPSIAFTVSEIDGVIKYQGEDFATYSGGPISVAKKTSDEYDLPCSLVLSPSFSLFTVLKIAASGNLEGLTTDISAKVTLKSGLSKVLRYTDMPLQDFLDE